MDNIKIIIQSLSSKEVGEFKNFLKRHKTFNERKDIKLVELLSDEQDYEPMQLVKLLGTKNLNAYHTIRKRLFIGLSEFIVTKLSREDDEGNHKIISAYHLSNYMFQIDLPELGWKFLVSSEKMAQEKNEFGLLNIIYLLQIKHVALQNKYLLEELISKYKTNKENIQTEENLILVKSIVLKELDKAKKKGVTIHFDKIIEAILKDYHIDLMTINHQKFIFNMIEIIRLNIVAQKHYFDFEPFIISQYHAYFKNDFTKVNLPYKASLLYMIAQTLYRNKKFKWSLFYLSELDELPLGLSNKLLKKIHFKRIQLKAANEVLLGRINVAIELLEKHVDRKAISNEDYYNHVINLGVYYFLQNDYKKSLKLLFKFNHSDNWYRKIMGLEWLLKRQVMEVILFYELNEIELYESRIKSIERSLKLFGKNEYYKRAFNFIHLLKDFVLNVGKSKDDDFNTKVENNIQWLPFEKEDVQNVAFYAWLKSKMLGGDYYKTLLELLATDSTQNQLK